jgi:hypothetical protein
MAKDHQGCDGGVVGCANLLPNKQDMKSEEHHHRLPLYSIRRILVWDQPKHTRYNIVHHFLFALLDYFLHRCKYLELEILLEQRCE